MASVMPRGVVGGWERQLVPFSSTLYNLTMAVGMIRMVRKRIMVTSMFAEEGEQLSGRRNFALGLIRDGTDLSW